MSDEGASIADAAKDSGAWGTFSGKKRGCIGSNVNDSQRSLGRLEEQEDAGTSAAGSRSSGGDRGGSRPAGSTTPKSPSRGVGARLR